MSPELVHALACYREWLVAVKNAEIRAGLLTDATTALTTEDKQEFHRLMDPITAEFAAPTE